MSAAPNHAVTVYTLGHGRHPFAHFLWLLREHGIELVCDVRSAARSRWPQYQGRALEEALRANGISYEWLPECGGKVVAPPAELARGLERIIELAAEVRVALLCSESQPLSAHAQPRANCHRVGLLSTPLKARGARVIHILPNGGAVELNEAELTSPWSQ